MIRLIFVILLLILAQASFAQQKTITITEECVYLDELTASHIPHIAVTCGIQPGDRKLFTKDNIQNFLTRQNLEGRVVNDIIVEREGEKLSPDNFAMSIEKAYKKAYPNTEIVIEQTRIPATLYAENQDKFEIKVDTTKFGGNYAQVKNGQKRFQVYYFVKGFQEGYITTDRVKVGESLAGKVRKELIDITNLKSKLANNPESLIASRSIPAGKAITIDIMQERPALQKGDSVKIVYNNGILKIETPGIVETNAMPGQPVAVRNIASQKVISTNYIGNGIVQAN